MAQKIERQTPKIVEVGLAHSLLLTHVHISAPAHPCTRAHGDTLVSAPLTHAAALGRRPQPKEGRRGALPACTWNFPLGLRDHANFGEQGMTGRSLTLAFSIRCMS